MDTVPDGKRTDTTMITGLAFAFCIKDMDTTPFKKALAGRHGFKKGGGFHGPNNFIRP